MLLFFQLSCYWLRRLRFSCCYFINYRFLQCEKYECLRTIRIEQVIWFEPTIFYIVVRTYLFGTYVWPSFYYRQCFHIPLELQHNWRKHNGVVLLLGERQINIHRHYLFAQHRHYFMCMAEAFAPHVWKCGESNCVHNGHSHGTIDAVETHNCAYS